MASSKGKVWGKYRTKEEEEEEEEEEKKTKEKSQSQTNREREREREREKMKQRKERRVEEEIRCGVRIMPPVDSQSEEKLEKRQESLV
uniref:Uncharacterized protein n=1 Tax=Octopus bimaculoides TaxID=37653 RepID=A0A0L8IHR5_OCTBM